MHVSTINPALEVWLGNSKVVADCGSAMVVFRGEHGAPEAGDLKTRLGSITFSASPEAASAYALEPNDDSAAIAPRVVPAYLRIQRPIFNDPDDPFVNMSVLIAALGFDAAAQLAVRHEQFMSEGVRDAGLMDDDMGGTFNSIADLIRSRPDKLGAIYVLAYRLLDDPEFVALSKAAGYDGAIHMGFGDFDETEYRVFDCEQVKSAIGNRGTYDGSDPDITHSRADGASEVGGHGWPLSAYEQDSEAVDPSQEAQERPRPRG